MGVAVSDTVTTLEGESGRLEGWVAIEAGLKALLLEALQEGNRRLVALDPDFVHWPWSDAEVLEALGHWGKGGRRLELLAPSYQACARRHPRFMQWRAHYDHVLRIGDFDPGEVGPDWPTGLLASDHGPVLRLLELEHGRARWTRAGPHLSADRHGAFELFDAIAQRSSPAWPFTQLGL